MKENEVIAIYCIIDDILKSLGWEDNRQAKMSSSEVLTTAIIACLAFGGNFTKSLNSSCHLFYKLLEVKAQNK